MAETNFTKQYPIGDNEKKYDGTSGSSDVEISTVKKGGEFYDPMKETRATRLGLNFESFKKAPGSTGGQVRRLSPTFFPFRDSL